MNVTCPNCLTHFKVPETAFKSGRRKMKCARCGHVWMADPPPEMAPVRPAAAMAPAMMAMPKPAVMAIPTSKMIDEIPLESPPPGVRRETMQDDVADKLFADHHMDGDFSLAEIDAKGFGGEGEDRAAEGADPFAEMSDMMMARNPETKPERLPPPKRMPRRRGGLILWLVLLFLLLSAVASGLYWFQDRLIDHWPQLASFYDKAGVRRDEVGAGLSFRNYNSERLVQDNNEVLIVRGVIANNTEQKHDIPLLRLALYNGPTLLQEKIIAPPMSSLEAHATAGFKVTLDQPDANATRFEVTFTAPKVDKPEKKSSQ